MQNLHTSFKQDKTLKTLEKCSFHNFLSLPINLNHTQLKLLSKNTYINYNIQNKKKKRKKPKKSLAVLALYREPENWKSVKEKDILPNYILRGLCSTITCSLVAYPQVAGK